MGIPLSGIDHMARQFWQSEGEEGTYIMYDAEVEPGMVSGAGLPAEEIIPLLKGKRLVVDSISTFILQHGIDAGVNLILRARDLVLSENANIMFVHYPDVLPQTAETQDSPVGRRRHRTEGSDFHERDRTPARGS